MGTALGLLSGFLVVATGGAWFRRMQTVRIPDDRTGFVAAMGVGAVLGAGAVAYGSGLAGQIASGVGLFGAAMFLLLVALSKQDAKTPAVAVGDALLDFIASDEDGASFDSATLRGRPVLLKFFRGHW